MKSVRIGTSTSEIIHPLTRIAHLTIGEGREGEEGSRKEEDQGKRRRRNQNKEKNEKENE